MKTLEALLGQHNGPFPEASFPLGQCMRWLNGGMFPITSSFDSCPFFATVKCQDENKQPIYISKGLGWTGHDFPPDKALWIGDNGQITIKRPHLSGTHVYRLGNTLPDGYIWINAQYVGRSA